MSRVMPPSNVIQRVNPIIGLTAKHRVTFLPRCPSMTRTALAPRIARPLDRGVHTFAFHVYMNLRASVVQCLQCDNQVFGHLPNQIIKNILVHFRSAASTSCCRFDLTIYLKSHYVWRNLARNSQFVCELNAASSLLKTCHQLSATHIRNSVISSTVHGLASEVYIMQNNCDTLNEQIDFDEFVFTSVITCKFTLTELKLLSLSRICFHFSHNLQIYFDWTEVTFIVTNLFSLQS